MNADIRFEWDSTKGGSNLRKHGISFETAVRVFSDPMHVSDQDRDENGEMRWQTLGYVDGVMLLLVVHTWTDDDGIEVIRIISARQAERHERRRYEQ